MRQEQILIIFLVTLIEQTGRLCKLSYHQIEAEFYMSSSFAKFVVINWTYFMIKTTLFQKRKSCPC